MGFEQGFRVSVAVEAPRETVWQALMDPREIVRWFGWEDDGAACPERAERGRDHR